MDEKEKLLIVLKDYYGSSRDDTILEEIAETIDSCIFDILEIYKDYQE